MLVVISDIHFSDGTAGEHNLPYSAFAGVFLSDIATLAKNNGAKEVKVLLLGDIFDLIRSSRWLDLDPSDRPWGAGGLRDIPVPRAASPTERTAWEILGRATPEDLANPDPPKGLARDTILFKNWGSLKLFRDFREHLRTAHGVDVPVEILYVPGNHDRLMNLYPSLRSEAARLLGLTPRAAGPGAAAGDPAGEWRLDNDFLDESYGVYARHGHQHDVWNYGGDGRYDARSHFKVPIGDVYTTEFSVKIPWMLGRMGSRYPAVTPDLVANLKNVDNVRPPGRVMEWIYYRVKSDSGQVRMALNEAFAEVFKEFLDIEFVQRWRSPRTRVDEALRTLSHPWLKWIPQGLAELLDAEALLPLFIGCSERPAAPDRDPLAAAAYNERIWRDSDRIRFVLYGHTHVPLQLPLGIAGNRPVFYLNTGTWRPRFVKTIGLNTVPDFVGLKQMTHLVFYREDEDLHHKQQGTISFDMWTGIKMKEYIPQVVLAGRGWRRSDTSVVAMNGRNRRKVSS